MIAACLITAAVADEREVAQSIEPTLPWLDNLDEALEASKKSGKPILLEFR